jgi:L-histidine N-alpha-methyltransferase
MLERIDSLAWQREAFRADVLEGLGQRRKTLPARWLYDDRGCELFEAITQLEEYYPTRTETGILREQAAALADFCGPGAVLLEYGAGAGIKTEILLAALRPALYVPIDIAGDFLDQTASRLEQRFPGLTVLPVVADFTTDFDLPEGLPAQAPRIGFFPGSTIGNLDREACAAFLCRMRAQVGAGGRAVIGIDLRKEIETLIAAYDDREGVTAAFDLNLLARINRELDGDFPLDRFAHEARWNARESAIEMHLVSRDAREVTVAGQRIGFAAGESIHTESSRKYDLAEIARLAAGCGWELAHAWTDEAQRFAVVGLEGR